MTPPPPPPAQDGNKAAPPPGTSPTPPKKPHISAAFVPAGQKIVMAGVQEVKTPNNNMKPMVGGKSVGAEKLVVVGMQDSKVAMEPDKQKSSNEGAPAIEGEKKCAHCAVFCPSISDLATHTKFWHSNISTKIESVPSSKGKEKAVQQQQRKFGHQNLSNFRGYKCYRCPHCPVMCDSQAQLNTHMGVCHSNASQPDVPLMGVQAGENQIGPNNKCYTCYQCGFTCNLEAQFMVHMRMHQHSNIQQKFRQTLSMNQRIYQEMAYQQKVKLDDIKKMGDMQKIKMDDINKLKQMQGILTDIEEGRVQREWGSKIGSPPPWKKQNQWAEERKMVKPEEERRFDGDEGLFSRRGGQQYCQDWKPKVVKDYSKGKDVSMEEFKMKRSGVDNQHQADLSSEDFRSALKKQKTEECNFENGEGAFRPKVFNYPGPEKRGQVEEVEGPKEAAAVIGEEVCKAVAVEKEKAVDVEKDQSESQMGNHWRKRLVGLC